MSRAKHCPCCGFLVSFVYSAEQAAGHLARETGDDLSRYWPAILVAKTLGFCSSVCVSEFLASLMLLGVKVPTVVEVTP